MYGVLEFSVFKFPSLNCSEVSCAVDDLCYCASCLQESQPFERIEVTRPQALEFFEDNQFKVNFFS
jgi:hypothetical protein